MNTQPNHDAETGDIRGSELLTTRPDGIAIGDLPNEDTATDDMRGHEPLPETDVESDRTKMIVGAVVAAIVLGAVASYATGMWNGTAPPPTRVAAIAVPQELPAVAPPAAVAPPVDQVAPRAEIEGPPVVKRSAAPSQRSALRAAPKAVVAPPEIAPPQIAPPETRPLIAAPLQPAPIAPPAIEPPAIEPPAQILPDQPASPPAP